jgi:hypothetical protein
MEQIIVGVVRQASGRAKRRALVWDLLRVQVSMVEQRLSEGPMPARFRDQHAPCFLVTYHPHVSGKGVREDLRGEDIQR